MSSGSSQSYCTNLEKFHHVATKPCCKKARTVPAYREHSKNMLHTVAHLCIAPYNNTNIFSKMIPRNIISSSRLIGTRALLTWRFTFRRSPSPMHDNHSNECFRRVLPCSPTLAVFARCADDARQLRASQLWGISPK